MFALNAVALHHPNADLAASNIDRSSVSEVIDYLLVMIELMILS